MLDVNRDEVDSPDRFELPENMVRQSHLPVGAPGRHLRFELVRETAELVQRGLSRQPPIGRPDLARRPGPARKASGAENPRQDGESENLPEEGAHSRLESSPAAELLEGNLVGPNEVLGDFRGRPFSGRHGNPPCGLVEASGRPKVALDRRRMALDRARPLPLTGVAR